MIFLRILPLIALRMDPMKRVVVTASRCVERRRKKESETRLDADLPIKVVTPSKNDDVLVSLSELLLVEWRVIISCFCCKLFLHL